MKVSFDDLVSLREDAIQSRLRSLQDLENEASVQNGELALCTERLKYQNYLEHIEVESNSPFLDQNGSVGSLLLDSVPKREVNFDVPLRDIKRRKGVEVKAYKTYAAQIKVSIRPLSALINTSHKVVTTNEWQLVRDELRLKRLVQRVDHLKSEGIWSFRQIKPHGPPPRPKSLWDYVLEEAAWISVDFRQERKWKMAMAYHLSHAVQEWHHSTDRASLCVKRSHDGRPTISQSNLQVLDSNSASTSVEQVLESTSSNEFLNTSSVDLLNTEVSTNEIVVSPVGLFSVPPTVKNTQIHSSLPLYSPPSTDNPTLTTPLNLVPVSWMMYDWPIAKDETIHTYPAATEPLKWLPLMSKYLPDQVDSGPFQDSNGEPRRSSVPQPRIPRSSVKASPQWTPDEEDALWNLSSMCHQNWAIISDMLTSMRVGTGHARSQWECHDRFVELKANGFEPSSRAEYLYSGPIKSNKIVTNDKKMKALKLMNTFEVILKVSQKQRDARKASQTKSNKSVNLTSHETHNQTEIQAGLNQNAPPLSPAELGVMKERRDKLLLEQQRLNQVRPGMMGRVPMGMGPPPFNRQIPNTRTGPLTPQIRPMEPLNPPRANQNDVMQDAMAKLMTRGSSDVSPQPNQAQQPGSPPNVNVPNPNGAAAAAAMIALQNAQQASKMKAMTTEQLHRHAEQTRLNDQLSQQALQNASPKPKNVSMSPKPKNASLSPKPKNASLSPKPKTLTVDKPIVEKKEGSPSKSPNSNVKESPRRGRESQPKKREDVIKNEVRASSVSSVLSNAESIESGRTSRRSKPVDEMDVDLPTKTKKTRAESVAGSSRRLTRTNPKSRSTRQKLEDDDAMETDELEEEEEEAEAEAEEEEEEEEEDELVSEEESEESEESVEEVPLPRRRATLPPKPTKKVEKKTKSVEPVKKTSPRARRKR